MTRVTIEVCAGSIADVDVARQTEADRIELNSALQLGGLTPSRALFEHSVRCFPKGVAAMIRPRAGGFQYDQREWNWMLRDAEDSLSLGVAGIVFGCLTEDGLIDQQRVREMVRLAQGADTIFHRAFDLLLDWRTGLEILADCGVRRVLSAGLRESAIEGADTLAEMVEFSRRLGLTIVAGGGIRSTNVREVLDRTGVSEIHGTFSRRISDSHYDRGPFRFAPNDQLRETDADELRALWSVLGRKGS